MFRFIRRPLAGAALILGGLVLAAALAFLFGLLVMLLWNWIMPEVFGLKTLTYWQSWGIVLLAHILFKAGGLRDRERRSSRDKRWKDRFREHFTRHFREEPGEQERESEGPQPEGA